MDFEVSNTGLKEVVGWVWFVSGDGICCGFVTSVLKLSDVGFGIKVLMQKVVFASSCFGFEVFSQINPKPPPSKPLYSLSHTQFNSTCLLFLTLTTPSTLAISPPSEKCKTIQSHFPLIPTRHFHLENPLIPLELGESKILYLVGEIICCSVTSRLFESFACILSLFPIGRVVSSCVEELSKLE